MDGQPLEGQFLRTAKTINKMVLCAVPLPAGSVATSPEDNCRRVATVNEYQGTVAEHLKDMYGGDGLPLVPPTAQTIRK